MNCQRWRDARGCDLPVFCLLASLMLLGCEGQQSDLASKLKALMGEQSASPATTIEHNPQQARQKKLDGLLKKAEAGDVLAMVDLGKAYELGSNWGRPIQFLERSINLYYIAAGDGISPRELQMAINWYEKAAQNGNAEAIGRLGRMYLLGIGVEENIGKALEKFQMAALQGDAVSEYGLGTMYGSGEGIAKDESKAQALIQKAADRGLSDAQSAIGGWHAEGYFGVTKDAAKAFDWWQKAAVQGHTIAQLSLGQAYRNGKGVPKDALKAIEWYGKSAAQGFGVAQFFLGMEYSDSSRPFADNVIAYAWLNLASAKNDQTAAEERDKLGLILSSAEIAEAQRLSSSWKVGMLLARESGSVDGGKQPTSPGSLVKKNTGTAFVVNAAGHAITNHHVVEGCTEVRAEGRDGVVKVVTSDVVNDLTQLQIPGAASAQATIANDPAKLRQGEDIVVFGFPLNAVLSSGGNLTPGVVSALTGLGNNTNQIQITAPIQPGSSGSPVINKKGEVVGVVSMKLSDTKMVRATGQVGQNVNFAVSGQTLKTFLDTHKVDYHRGGMFSFGGKSTADLADEARKWTLVVECWQ